MVQRLWLRALHGSPLILDRRPSTPASRRALPAATRYTEQGFHGKDVDTIIKDLMDAALLMVKELKVGVLGAVLCCAVLCGARVSCSLGRLLGCGALTTPVPRLLSPFSLRRPVRPCPCSLQTEQVRGEVGPAVEARIIEALTGPGAAEDTVESFRGLLRSGALDDREVVVDVPVKDKGAGPLPPTDVDISVAGMGPGGSMGASIDLGEFMQVSKEAGLVTEGEGGVGTVGGWVRRCSCKPSCDTQTLPPSSPPLLPQRIMPGARGKPQMARKSLKVKDARAALEEVEIEKRLASIDMRREAVQCVVAVVAVVVWWKAP
jgi:hypothetical protein